MVNVGHELSEDMLEIYNTPLPLSKGSDNQHNILDQNDHNWAKTFWKDFENINFPNITLYVNFERVICFFNESFRIVQL